MKTRMKLQSLTQAQIDKFPYYVEKWSKIGLSTQTNRQMSEQVIDDVYKAADLPPPQFKIWLKSPKQGAIGAFLLRSIGEAGGQAVDQVGEQVRDQVLNQVLIQTGDRVWSQVWSEIEVQVRDQVWSQVVEQVRDQVGEQVRDQVGEQVWSEIEVQVRDQVWSQVVSQTNDQNPDKIARKITDQMYTAGYGCQDAYLLSFYDFFISETNIENLEKIKPLIQLSHHCGWFWPFKNVVILTEKPTEIHLNENNRLHRDGGAAIQYSDGFSVWALNGLRVPEWLAVTPKEKLDPAKVIGLPNAEQRQVGIRKIGLENCLEHLKANRLDQKKSYELYTIQFEGETIGPYLKMTCPSTGRVYFEGVGEPGFDRSITNVDQALQWRFQRAAKNLLTKMNLKLEVRA